jgi:hypothetical protein
MLSARSLPHTRSPSTASSKFYPSCSVPTLPHPGSLRSARRRPTDAPAIGARTVEPCSGSANRPILRQNASLPQQRPTGRRKYAARRATSPRRDWQPPRGALPLVASPARLPRPAQTPRRRYGTQPAKRAPGGRRDGSTGPRETRAPASRAIQRNPTRVPALAEPHMDKPGEVYVCPPKVRLLGQRSPVFAAGTSSGRYSSGSADGSDASPVRPRNARRPPASLSGRATHTHLAQGPGGGRVLARHE